ncbi:MAG: carboxypeptidase regulatory-like domain-containing protein [Actinobacteria bacterium]|nr:carboxypeptidase regulatory-like domain-containing protein [Actinomycetota bacterium]
MSDDSMPSIDTLAAAELDVDDIATLRRVAALYDLADPVPDGLVERIQFDMTLDALHAEIAKLQRLESELVGARGGAEPGATEVQTVTFTSPSLTTMVTITPAGAERVRLDGWAAPGAGVRVELRTEGADRTVVADEDGRFVFDDVPRGLAQFVLRSGTDPAKPPVITPSIEI